MRFSQRRHIGSAFLSHRAVRSITATLESGRSPAPFEREFAPRDYVAFLLHMDAQIEHGLMVQYLYAAYSLGGPQVPVEHREMVRSWREILLGIAKEEMGHLITVLNVLRLLGAPLSLERDDYPWSTPFYPFPFALEPLTLDSLAKYVYAESPKDWTGPQADEIKARVKQSVANPQRVGDLFATLIDRVSDSQYLAEAAFQPATTEFQADFSEWGRGYQQGKRGNASGANPKGTPDLVVMPLWSRGEAIAALKRIAEQGEALASVDDAAPSHFARFLKVYEEMSKVAGSWSPSLNIATNPYVSLDAQAEPEGSGDGAATSSAITHPESIMWAQLHNIRYRMLLALLEHTFYVSSEPAAVSGGARGALINASFGEMYNLRAIAETLMRLPLSSDGTGLAGPPFQMPYILQLPLGQKDKWRLHLDLLDASKSLIQELELQVSDTGKAFLATCLGTDEQFRLVVNRELGAPVRV